MSSRTGRLSQTYIQRTAHVRARFEYDPSKDSSLPKEGLAFHYGDILHIMNDSDSEWWRAERLTALGEREAFGIVPSKYRAIRAREVKSNLLIQTPESSLSSKARNKSSSARKFLCITCNSDDSTEDDTSVSPMNVSAYDFECTPPTVPYEYVKQRPLKYTRPVFIIGALRAPVNDFLVDQFSEKYDGVVPTTTREKRPNEEEGIDYHYVTKEEMEKDINNGLYIEAGTLSGNLYGTSIASVKEVAEQGKHCILDIVSKHAIRKLQKAELYPIIIFVHPKSFTKLMALNDVKITDEEAEEALKISRKFEEHITVVLKEGTASEMSEILIDMHKKIQEESGPDMWVPAGME